MVRNRNIDIVRAVALILVLIYHCWVRLGSIQIDNYAVLLIIRLGGEIGVTAFFVLSGFGIYQSLYYNEQTGKIQYFSYIKKRLKRILPQYYLNLLVALLFTSAAVYINRVHILNILSHVLLIHNFFPSFAGAINGVLWTMGVTFQFYLLAVFLYKILNKFGMKCVLLGIVFTVLCKATTFHFFKSYLGVDKFVIYSFWFSRQLIFTVLDNFLIGMGVAYITQHFKGISKSWVAVTGCFMSVTLMYFVCKVGVTYGIHTDNISGYLWHSEVAICIGCIILFAYYIGGENKNYICKVLLALSKYEFGIYLWHLLIIDNLMQNSPLIQQWLNFGNYLGVGIIFVAAAIGVGVILQK